MAQRLISADDHVDLSHDKIRSFLDPKFHDDYTGALKAFGASMSAMGSTQANQRWREQEGLQGPSETNMQNRPATGNPAWGRACRHRRREPASGHGYRRGRGVLDLLRGQRVPLPVHGQERLARGHPGLQHGAAGLRVR